MTKPTTDFAFEPALTELEAITAAFEAGDIDLDQSLARFERGLELVGKLKDHLSEVENRVEKIKLSAQAQRVEGDEDEPPQTSGDGLVTTEQLPF